MTVPVETDAQELLRLRELSLALANPGKLVIGPTDSTPFTGSFPFGGDGFALVKKCVWAPGPKMTELVDEYWGDVSNVVRHGEKAVFAFLLESWSGDCFKWFLNTNTTAQGYADTFRIDPDAPGKIAAMPHCAFISDDPNGRCVAWRRPVALLDPTFSVAFGLRDDSILPLIFVATRSSTDTASKRPWQVGRLRDLDL